MNDRKNKSKILLLIFTLWEVKWFFLGCPFQIITIKS